MSAQLDAGTKARDAFAIDLAKLEKDRTSLTDFVRGYIDRLAVERKEFDAFDQRVKALQTSIGEAEKGMEGLAARDRLAASIGQRVDQLVEADADAQHPGRRPAAQADRARLAAGIARRRSTSSPRRPPGSTRT